MSKETTITDLVLSKNRTVHIHTSNRNQAVSSLKFYHHEMSSFVPLRSKDLIALRDALSKHIKDNEIQ